MEIKGIFTDIWNWGKSKLSKEEEAKVTQIGTPTYYNDSLISLKDQERLPDTKWHPAEVNSAKRPAPGSLTVQEATEMLEDSSPLFKDVPEVKTFVKSENLEKKIETLSKLIDDELKKPDRNFERLQALVYLAVVGLMHKFKQVDQEFIFDSGLQIKVQAVKVQGTYNTWPAVTITIVSSAISIAGGMAGLAPLVPVSWISAQTAGVFAGASQSIGTAGTGLGGVGSIFNTQSESIRFVYQIDLEEIKKKREDKEGAKHQKSQRGNDAKNELSQHIRQEDEVRRAIMQVN
jgi:hypothetical protein